MADLAKLANVSPSTVSRALAGSTLVATKKRQEIFKLARKHGFVVNSIARNLRLKRTQIISVVIPLGHDSGQSLADPFLSELLGHIADKIAERGYGMFVQKILPPMRDWLPRLVGSNQSDGIIIIGQSTEHKALQAVAADYRPMVVWGGHMVNQRYCSVGTDNAAGSMAATAHLLSLGRRRIIFLGDPAIPEVGLRFEGYKHALARRPRGVAGPRVVPTHMTAFSSYETVRALLLKRGRFDAVVAASDVIAMSAIRAITAAGLSVPKDIAIVGFDDIALASYINPPLTTIRQDMLRGAGVLVDLLFRRIAGENTPAETMPSELIVRESSGRRQPARDSDRLTRA